MTDAVETPSDTWRDGAGELKVHYHLQGGVHQMDAVTRNKAEGELLALLREVSGTLGVPFLVETKAYGEGGVVEYLDLIFQHKEQITFVMAVLSPLLGTPFYLAKLRQTKQQTLLNELTLKKLKLEIAEKVAAAEERAQKKASEQKPVALPLEPPATPDDIAKALLARKKIARRRSNYYEALLEDARIEAVGYAQAHQREAAERLVRRATFADFVVDRVDMEPLVYKRIQIEVVAPVLRSGSLKWRGIFDKKVISFDLQDEGFRDRVAAKRVQFQNGTTLLCDLEVLQREDETGGTEVTGYVVSEVHEVRSPPPPAETPRGEQMHLHLVGRPGADGGEQRV